MAAGIFVIPHRCGPEFGSPVQPESVRLRLFQLGNMENYGRIWNDIEPYLD